MTGLQVSVDFSTVTYKYVAWKEEGVWTAHCPAIPGVYGLGSSVAASVSDLEEALRLLAEHVAELGERLPRGGQISVGTLEI